MVPESRKEDYIFDTLETIKRCLKGKEDYFGISLYAEIQKPFAKDCMEDSSENPDLLLYTYSIYMEQPDTIPPESLKRIPFLSIERDSLRGMYRLLLVRIFTTNNNLDIIETGTGSTSTVHLSLYAWISANLNQMLRDYTGIGF